MILEKKPLSIAEVIDYAKDSEGKEEFNKYLKRFGKIKKEKAIKIKEKMLALNNNKIKESNIVKVIDFLPETQEEMNKIFSDSNLNEDEANAIAEIVKSS